MKNTTRQKDEPLFFQCDNTCRHCMGKDLSKYTVHVQTSREPLDRLLRERVLLVASLRLYISTEINVSTAHVPTSFPSRSRVLADRLLPHQENFASVPDLASSPNRHEILPPGLSQSQPDSRYI
jgi:hypothetical protein